jgi:hypothetical protein
MRNPLLQNDFRRSPSPLALAALALAGLAFASIPGPSWATVVIEPGGPDASDHVYFQTNRAWQEPGDPGAVGVVALPFDFTFYGTDHTQVGIDAAGLRFSGSAPAVDNSCLPNSVAVDVAPFWDAVTVTAIHTEAVTLDAQDAFVIAWTVTIGAGEGRYEVILFADGALEFVYQDVDFGDGAADNGASATIGIQDALNLGAGGALQVSCDDGILGSGASIRFEPGTDGDGDGFFDRVQDCDDGDPSVFPGAPEACDGVDTDCDPTYDEDSDPDGDGSDLCDGDCDEADGANFPGNPEVCDDADNDCNGVADSPRELDPDGDGATCDDCDDDDPDFFPGAPELCDGADNDCDGAVPADESDGDSDGYRACAECADDDPARNPDATELCNGLDDDCDGATLQPWTTEPNPVDGFETAFRSVIGSRVRVDRAVNFVGMTVPLSADAGETVDFILYEAPAATVQYQRVASASHTFAADTAGFEAVTLTLPWDLKEGYFYLAGVYAHDPFTQSRTNVNVNSSWPVNLPFGAVLGTGRFDNASASELDVITVASNVGSNGVRLLIGGEHDLDDDGFIACEECDDHEPAAAPDLTELCDGIDNDCVGGADADVGGETENDGDGFRSCEECDDASADRYPGNPEVCDGLDNDCDPATGDDLDVDGDGTDICGGDCDDSDATIRPLALELCDGADTDCDPTTDEAIDFDGDGASACDGDCNDTRTDLSPSLQEACDGVDNDCDGTLPPEEADADGDDFRICDGDCNDDRMTIHPSGTEDIEQTCTDGLDNDCDGLVDADEADTCRAFHRGCSVAGRPPRSTLLLLPLILFVRRKS